jgi:hypothetical protein
MVLRAITRVAAPQTLVGSSRLASFEYEYSSSFWYSSGLY